jgi:hypothetical protein
MGTNRAKGPRFQTSRRAGAANGPRGNQGRSHAPALRVLVRRQVHFASSNPNSYNPVKTVSAPIEQATIGRTLVIKGEISGAEALYVDGRIEGKISLPENRVTIGRNGSVQANITAREVVVMGKVNGKHRVHRPRGYPQRRLGHGRRFHHSHQRGRWRRAQRRHRSAQRRPKAPPAESGQSKRRNPPRLSAERHWPQLQARRSTPRHPRIHTDNPELIYPCNPWPSFLTSSWILLSFGFKSSAAEFMQ